MKAKLIFGVIGLLILLSAVFGYRGVTRSRKEETLVGTPSPLKIPQLELPSAEIQRAAEEELPRFLRGLAYDEMALESYGIKSFEEAQSATLGRACHLYTVGDLTELANYSQGQKASLLITPAQTWYFAVLINNEPRVDLEVSWHESRWQAVGIGGSLSKEMAEVEREIPILLGGKAITCPLKLVRIFPLNAVFVFLECDDKEFIIPLTPTGWFNLEEKKLYPAEEAMPRFAEEAKRILQEPPGLIGR